ncbi:MAG TPA: SDR family oxidoreductase [Anaeromyxobacteraceae bacterium]|nr:SDR family oxidoreductase [Anaeromyxobacteraceae bacterium]
MKDLDGRVALVTGAYGGIGAAVARALARDGAAVVLTGRDQASLAAVDLGPGEGRALRLRLDVGDPAAWEAVVARVLAERGRLDVLVNNAGVVEPGAVESLPAGEVERQVRVNLLGAAFGCRAVIPAMRARGEGAIVTLASLGGIVPMPFEAVYCATKYALRGLSFALRAELRGSGIRVTVVSPDSVETRQLRQELQHDEASLSFASAALPPEAVARAVLRAVRKGPPEILVPSASGLLARLLMAFPGLVLWLLPMLRRMGARRMARRRRAAP